MSTDLGPINVLGADAVGQPGQRRFRIFARGQRGSAIMWMEKEQLNSLAATLDRALAMVTEGQVLRVEASSSGLPEPPTMPADFPAKPTYELQVGQMRLSFDEQEETFLLSISPLEIEMERGREPQVVINEENSVSFAFTLQDAQALSTSITTVVASGRPVCPLCHTPLDGGPHACAKQNGHHKILPLEGEEEEEE